MFSWLHPPREVGCDSPFNSIEFWVTTKPYYWKSSQINFSRITSRTNLHLTLISGITSHEMKHLNTSRCKHSLPIWLALYDSSNIKHIKILCIYISWHIHTQARSAGKQVAKNSFLFKLVTKLSLLTMLAAAASRSLSNDKLMLSYCAYQTSTYRSTGLTH